MEPDNPKPPRQASIPGVGPRERRPNGRPVRKAGPKTSILLPEDLLPHIDAICQQTGKSRREFVIAAVRRAIGAARHHG